MEIACNNCGSENRLKFQSVKCYSTGFPLNVVKCADCGLVYLSPRPDKSLGLEYFEKAYSNAEGFEGHEYYRDHDSIFRRNHKRFNIIKSLDVPNKMVLDFGAGQGHFVKVVRDSGWQGEGTELAVAAIESAKKNFDIELFDSLEKLPTKEFGVIALWDVIEHLEDPKGIITELSKYLHPNGYFIIETSNIDSLDYVFSGRKWSYWHVDHLYYFSIKSLKYLLNTLEFKTVAPKVSVFTTEKRTFFQKLKKYANPVEFMKALKVLFLSKKHKDLPRESLMTLIFTKK